MTDKAKRKGGRPRVEFTDATKARICREVALGKSLRRVLKARGMPSKAKVMGTLQEDTLFADQYARARQRGIESHIDEILDLADSATPANAHAVRLKVDTRKWLASKLVPKVYGDKIDVTSGDEPLIPADRNALVLDLARAVALLIDERVSLPDGAAQVLRGTSKIIDAEEVKIPEPRCLPGAGTLDQPAATSGPTEAADLADREESRKREEAEHDPGLALSLSAEATAMRQAGEAWPRSNPRTFRTAEYTGPRRLRRR